MLFAYDGTGLGHLMRLIKIAWGMSKDCQVLVVSGHKAMPDIIPKDVPFFLLPNFYELRDKDSCTNEQANQIRIKIIDTLIREFCPDAFVTDYLPLGKRCELARVITGYNCLKYFVLRSDIGGERLTHEDVFSKRNIVILAKYYHRILLASDSKVTPIEIYSWLPKDVFNKIVYIGCVTYSVPEKQIEETRCTYMKRCTRKWLVCSAGGGKISREFSKKCIEMSKDKRLADWSIDIILGNYSQISWPYGLSDTYNNRNVTIHKKLKDLYLLHASADCIVCSGGYNFLLESIQGKPKQIFAYSVMDFTVEEEQVNNIRGFGKYYPITEISSLESMSELIEHISENSLTVKNEILDLNGIKNAASIIINDMKHFS